MRGGLTWVGWLGVGVGALLVYAGMTGQSLVSELSGVLNGGGLVKGAPAGGGPVGADTPANLIGNHPLAQGPGGSGGQVAGGGAVTTPDSGARYPLVLPPAAPRVAP